MLFARILPERKYFTASSPPLLRCSKDKTLLGMKQLGFTMIIKILGLDKQGRKGS